MSRSKVRKSIVIMLVTTAMIIAGMFGVRYFMDRNHHIVLDQDVTLKDMVHMPEETKPLISENSFSLFMVGDALLHSTIYAASKQADGSYYFEDDIARIGEIARNYDLRYYNQETLLGGTELELSGYPTFNSPQEWGEYMVREGFNIVSTANNHSLDRWGAGIEASEAFWKSQEGVIEEGMNLSWDEYNEIRLHEQNGITYAYFAWTYGMNGLHTAEGEEYLVNCYDGNVDFLLSQVEKANEMADLVIVAMHWGTEYQFYPNEEQQELAQQLADAGADIIIGNHPHVIEPVQWLNDKHTICFYALGNLISDQYIYETSMSGMMAALTVRKISVGNSSFIMLDDVKADLHYTWLDLSTHTGFDVIPYSQLDSSLYSNYESTYADLCEVIQSMGADIQIGGF